MEKLRVLIADDHPMFCHGVRMLLESKADFEVVGEAASGEEAIELARTLEPDVILMDIRMPGINGIEATKEIMKENKQIKVLMVTMFEDDASVFTAMRVGARGYILKDADREDILRAIRAVGRGEAIFSPEIASRLIDYFATANPATREEVFPELSVREREVLYMISDGASNQQISERLNLSKKTVANYISTIMNKLQVQDRDEAIKMAREARGL
jgi:DNA-binding NarL/FixJ family response regulator